jgi:hypothetical protein
MPLINYIGNRQESLSAGGFVRGNAAPPPALSFDYIVVGGGAAGQIPGLGGSGGGVRSGSAASLSFNTTLNIVVGAGGTAPSGVVVTNGASSSISASSFGFIGAGGATGNSGQPSEFSRGLAGPEGSNGGGAGSSQDGQDGVEGKSGNGGNGSIWVNGLYYGGGGGGVGGGVAGDPGLGGGGTAITPGTSPDGLTFQLNGHNGRGGGSAGSSGYDVLGGSGSVIIRYATASVVAPYDNTISGGTLEISGGYAYRTFTGSSQLVYSY